ncbi:MAG: hypothetical protein PVJ33_05075 [Lysobacterales bacterium]
MSTKTFESWAFATELLDQVLQFPPGRRDEAARRLGDLWDVQSELEQLLRGTRGVSVLDEPLQCLLRQVLTTHRRRLRRWG